MTIYFNDSLASFLRVVSLAFKNFKIKENYTRQNR